MSSFGTLCTMTATDYFLDELVGAAPAGAAPTDIEALARDALDRGLPQTTPDIVVACISVGDCTSRNPQTQIDLVDAKIRRMGGDILRHLRDVASENDTALPDLHIRLRHSPLLLTGHGPDVWPTLAQAVCEAAREAGVSRTTLPVVCWDISRFAELLPDVTPALPNADIRIDFHDEPCAQDIQCLSTALVLSRTTANARFIISAQRASCPMIHPESVDFHVQTVFPGLSTDAPIVSNALARTIARTNRQLAHSLAAVHDNWRAGMGHLELRGATIKHLRATPDLIHIHNGWPTGSGRNIHITLRSDTTPEQLQVELERMLSEPGYVVVSGTGSP